MKLLARPADGKEGQNPLFQALERQNLRQVCRLLKRQAQLSWWEVSLYAPMTFGWAPMVLGWMLDLGPKREVTCQCEWVRPEDGWHIQVNASLLTAAAAVNDLRAVEVLLAHGYAAFPDSPEAERRKRALDLEGWYRIIHGAGKVDARVDCVDLIPDPCPDGASTALSPCDPLSAAIWCGAEACALRLLPDRPEELTPAARQALRRQDGLSPASRSTIQAVCRALGCQPEDFWQVEDLLCFQLQYGCDVWTNARLGPENVHALRACLTRQGAQLDIHQVQLLLMCADQDWMYDLLPLIPGPLLAYTLLHFPVCYEASWRDYRRAIRRVYEHPAVQLSLPRCCVPPQARYLVLLDALEHMEFTGQAPPGEVSGLAMALLHSIVDGYFRCPDLARKWKHRLLYHPRTARLLAEEDPALVAGCLRWQGSREDMRPGRFYEIQPPPEQAIHLILLLLGIKEERGYEL